MKFMFLIGAFLQATINYAFAKCEPDLILLGGESAKISVVEPDTGCFQIGKKYYRFDGSRMVDANFAYGLCQPSEELKESKSVFRKPCDPKNATCPLKYLVFQSKGDGSRDIDKDYFEVEFASKEESSASPLLVQNFKSAFKISLIRKGKSIGEATFGSGKRENHPAKLSSPFSMEGKAYDFVYCDLQKVSDYSSANAGRGQETRSAP